MALRVTELLLEAKFQLWIKIAKIVIDLQMAVDMSPMVDRLMFL